MPARTLPTDLPVRGFRDAAAFEAWLGRNTGSKGVWLRFAKKGTGVKSVTYDEALDAALCHGWIDGQTLSIDATYYLQRFTPRRPRSVWSKRNVGKVEALIAAGRMKPAGLAQVEAAKADGRWDVAYDGPRNMVVPEDLERALARNRKARAFFARLDRTNRFAICFRVQTARRPETRRARIERLVAMLERGEKPIREDQIPSRRKTPPSGPRPVPKSTR